MFRRFVLFFAIALAFWQCGVVGGQSIAFGQPEASAHALMHWAGEPHHHDDSGHVAEDGSDESVRHIASDGCAGGSALWPAGLWVSCLPPMPSHVAATDQAARPGPALDGPMRPPRHTT